MKQVFTLFLTIVFTNVISSQVSKNFTAIDCIGKSHTLHQEANDTTAIVLVWVMPCPSCTTPAVNAYNETRKFLANNPKKVKFYVVDDYNNTSCASLKSWCNTNKLDSVDAYFCSDSIDMANFGGAGMPKIVVIGGANDSIYFNQNNNLSIANFNAALIKATTKAAVVVNNAINAISFSKLAIYPNPVSSNITKISYQLEKSSEVKIEVLNLLGSKIETIVDQKQSTGIYDMNLDVSKYTNGLYFVKISSNGASEVLQFSVEK
jgi:hypothetical protein